MNSRDRVFAALQRKEPDRVPKLEWLIDPIVIQKIHPGWNYADFIENSNEDVAVAWPDMHTKKIDQKHEIDEWGITKGWTTSSGTLPVPIKPAITSQEDFDRFTPPDPLADYRYNTLRALVKRFKGKKAICFFAHDAWEYPSAFRGTAELLTDFILDPDFAKKIIQMVVDYQVQVVKKAIDLGAEIIVTGDDYCSNQGPLMSPAHFKEFILPGLKRVVETSKANGAYFIKHCDGNVWPLLDMIIDTGIDAFHPFQPDVMDINEAKRKYKNKITLVGNIDCGDLLCNGKPGEVENAVKRTIRNVGKDGGFILASSNCISAGVKADNYLTMLEAVEKWGYYPLADK